MELLFILFHELNHLFLGDNSIAVLIILGKENVEVFHIDWWFPLLSQVSVEELASLCLVKHSIAINIISNPYLVYELVYVIVLRGGALLHWPLSLDVIVNEH